MLARLLKYIQPDYSAIKVRRIDLTLWRIQTRPYGGEWDWGRVWEHCLETSVLGIGWQVPTAPRTFEDYEAAYSEFYPGDSAGIGNIRRLASAQPGELIWTRDPDGLYWIGQVVGEWQYRSDEQSAKADITNVLPVNLVKVGTNADVPGKVISSFRARRTFQRILSDPASIFSDAIFAHLFEGKPIAQGNVGDVFDLIDAEHMEDILFVKLQTEGWVVLPEGRKADTMAYEFVAKRPSDGKLAIIQVKTGGSPVDLDALGRAADHSSVAIAYGFQPNSHYVGSGTEKISIIERAEVIEFMKTHRSILPAPVNVWMDFAGL